MTLERVDCWCDILSSRNVCNGDVDAELACLIMSIAYFKRNLGAVSIGDDGDVCLESPPSIFRASCRTDHPIGSTAQ